MKDFSQIAIDSFGARGDGVGRLPDGRRVFVAGGLPGEKVSVEIGDARDDGVGGRLETVIEPSPDRIMPTCQHFGICGGCVLQHVNDQAYAAFKMEQVGKALARHNLSPKTMEGPFVSTPGSRRRASFAAYRGPDRLVVGFNEQRSIKIVDQKECPVLRPRLQEFVAPLRKALGGILQEGQGMDISVIESAGMIDVVLRPWVKKKKDSSDHLPRHIAERLAAFAEEADIARLSWQVSADDESDLMQVVLRDPFTVDLSGVAVTPPPGAFLQATIEGEQALTQAVLAGMGKKTKKIVDLYAGSGTFTFALSMAKYKVHAVEGFAPALDALKIAMPGKPVTAEKRDLAKDPLMAKELKDYDAVVLDPPRVGAMEQIKMIARADVPVVVYVSCNPVSFAKDSELLVQRGYTFEKLTVVDQFLWSPHVELVGVFKL